MPALATDAALSESWRLSPDRLLAHLTRNEVAIEGFGEGSFALGGPYQRPPHVRYIGDRIARTIARGNGRLIINTPPQVGKSLLASKATPTWALHITEGRARVLLGSYEHRYAMSWGRATRSTVEQYADDLGIVLSSDRYAADEWTTVAGGGMQTGGVGGPMTGKSGDIIIVDDPFKNFRDAHSPANREHVWDWFHAVIMSRIQPGGTVIVIQTRWHEDDLTGRLTTRPGKERWETIRLPALAEADDPLGRAEGESIWPERFPIWHYEDVRISSGAYIFAGMYQQRPAPLEGEMFKRRLWRYADELPAGARLVRRWDLAGTAGGGDWTVGVLMARAEDGRFFVVDVIRERLGPLDVETMIKNTADADASRYGRRVLVRLEQEPGSEGKAWGEHMVKRVLAGHIAKALPSSGDKALRAMPYAAQQEASNVYLLRRFDSENYMEQPWFAEFIEEHAIFPSGAHDDQVDAASGAFADLTTTAARPARTTSVADRRLVQPGARRR